MIIEDTVSARDELLKVFEPDAVECAMEKLREWAVEYGITIDKWTYRVAEAPWGISGIGICGHDRLGVTVRQAAIVQAAKVLTM